MPDKGEIIMFQNYHRQLPVPFEIYVLFFKLLEFSPSFNFLQEVLNALKCSNFVKLKQHDQLREQKDKGNVFLGFGMFFS